MLRMKGNKRMWKQLAKLLKLKKINKTLMFFVFVKKFNLASTAGTKSRGIDLNPGFLNPGLIPLYYQHMPLF